jgi:eukaryotic-like serine/threonine-protein kinase
VVIALAWWVGSTLLDVTHSVEDGHGSTPSVSAPANGSASSSAPAAAGGAAVAVARADVFDPGGDGQPENDKAVPLALDGDPATAWSTLTYQGSPAFGNLKDGVGLLLDLGSAQAVGSVTLTTDTPGATVEIRTGDAAGKRLDDFDAGPADTLQGNTDLAFDKPVTARYVLVWITGLVPTADGFSADLSEIVVHAAG